MRIAIALEDKGSAAARSKQRARPRAKRMGDGPKFIF